MASHGVPYSCLDQLIQIKGTDRARIVGQPVQIFFFFSYFLILLMDCPNCPPIILDRTAVVTYIIQESEDGIKLC